jgi:hypothetical protein
MCEICSQRSNCIVKFLITKFYVVIILPYVIN